MARRGIGRRGKLYADIVKEISIEAICDDFPSVRSSLVFSFGLVSLLRDYSNRGNKPSPTSLFRIELIADQSWESRVELARVHGIEEKAVEEESGDVHWKGEAVEAVFRIDVQLR